jgi:hypothetical protein
MGRAPSGPARLSPARAKQAGNGHGPVVFPGPAQRQLKKSLFHFLFIILDEKHLENDFLVILAPNLMKQISIYSFESDLQYKNVACQYFITFL